MPRSLGRRKELRKLDRQQVVQEEYGFDIGALPQPIEIPVDPDRELTGVEIDGVSREGAHQ